MDSQRNRWPVLVSTWTKTIWAVAKLGVYVWHELHAAR
jgi:hypothetical protein